VRLIIVNPRLRHRRCFVSETGRTGRLFLLLSRYRIGWWKQSKPQAGCRPPLPRKLQQVTVAQTFLSASSGDFPVAPFAGLESPASRQAGKPALHCLLVIAVFNFGIQADCKSLFSSLDDTSWPDVDVTWLWPRETR